MDRLFLVAVLGLALVLSSPLVGAQDMKIGYVDTRRVTQEAPQAEAARASLEDEFGPRDQEISQEQEELRELEQRLRQDAAALSESEGEELRRELVARQREVRRSEAEFREDFNLRRNEELGQLQQRIIDVISRLAEEENFDLVVSEGVLYASERVDITERVLDRLERQHEDG
ncbi:MAG: OmpH family outer membrane protein [Ectothiorhodospiraceae bacterium]